MVVSTTEGNSIPGTFRRVRSQQNNRPVYLQPQRSLYLYFYVDASFQAWIVGPTLGSASGLMYAYDVTADPSMSRGTWTVYRNNTFVVDENLQIICEGA